MTRIALGIEYEGTRYHGWQSQLAVNSVQETLESALSKVADISIKTQCAGRTDAGVHATGQVVHFECLTSRPLKAWTLGTNSYLPDDICVRWAKVVDDTFHARFSALSRRYQYYIFNSPIRPCMMHHTLTWHYKLLDEILMNRAGQFLIGEHDFSSFRSVDCQSLSPFRHVFKLDVHRKNNLVVIDIIANSFLHNMVRNIVGLLMVIGENKQPPEWAREVLQTKSKSVIPKTASPRGLFLVEVIYPDSFELPNQIQHPFFWD
jgi:tRNA pseudouridine38-40 synthase